MTVFLITQLRSGLRTTRRCPVLRNCLLLCLCSFIFLGQTADHVFADKSKRLLGQSVGEFSIKDYRGRTHSLSAYAENDVVVLAFLGTECPLAKLYSPRLQPTLTTPRTT